MANEYLHIKLQQLCDEYASALRAIADEQSRGTENALTVCMTEMSKIESEADADCRRAHEEYMKADQAAPQPGQLGAHYWDYQKRLAEIAAAAREKADAARKTYLDACKASEKTLEDLCHKARIDFLKRTKETWGAADIDQLNATTTEKSAQAVWAGFSLTAHC